MVISGLDTSLAELFLRADEGGGCGGGALAAQLADGLAVHVEGVERVEVALVHPEVDVRGVELSVKCLIDTQLQVLVSVKRVTLIGNVT